MPRHYPPHFRREMIDRMLGGEAVLAPVLETSVPEQTLHRWKHCQAPGLVEVRLDPFDRCDGRGGAVQKFVLNLNWWPVVDLTVEPAMVEPVDIFGRRYLKVVDAPPGSFVTDQFGFEQRVERLREGVDAPMSVNS